MVAGARAGAGAGRAVGVAATAAALASLGNIPALRTLIQVRRGRRWLRAMCYLIGVSVLIVGVAGPQWGRDPNPGVAAIGRDLVVALT